MMTKYKLKKRRAVTLAKVRIGGEYRVDDYYSNECQWWQFIVHDKYITADRVLVSVEYTICDCDNRNCYSTKIRDLDALTCSTKYDYILVNCTNIWKQLQDALLMVNA